MRVVTLGSHWKAIRLDADGRISASRTSLSGELIHAAQTQTILASSVPQGRPLEIDQKWVKAGMQVQRRSGLGRALFCVRLLEQRYASTPEERLAFLIGTFIAADLDPMMTRGLFDAHTPVVLAGGGALAEAWRCALADASVTASTLPDTDVERALLAGLQSIGIASGLAF